MLAILVQAQEQARAGLVPGLARALVQPEQGPVLEELVPARVSVAGVVLVFDSDPYETILVTS